MWYTLLHVFLYLHILAGKKASLQCVFPVFSVVFGHDLLYWEFKNRYSKKPVYVTKRDISDHIYKLIHISLCMILLLRIWLREFIKNDHFETKMRILWHNANSVELLNPENDWPWHCPTTNQRAKKRRYITLKCSVPNDGILSDYPLRIKYFLIGWWLLRLSTNIAIIFE